MIMWPGNVLFIIIVPILLMKKLKPGEVNNYIARSVGSQNSNPGHLDVRAFWSIY